MKTISLIFIIAVLAFAAFEIKDCLPSNTNYIDSLKTVIKANERTIWLLRNDSVTHNKCFRIND